MQCSISLLRQILPHQSEASISTPRDDRSYARPGDLPDSPAPLLCIGSGPLGTLLLLSCKEGSSAPKSSRVLLDSPAAPPLHSALLPPIAAAAINGGDGLSATKDIRIRTPNKVAAAAVARLPDRTGLLIIPTRRYLCASAKSSLSSAFPRALLCCCWWCSCDEAGCIL